MAVYKIRIEDKKKIKDITFKFPELMGEDARKLILGEYEALVNLQDRLYLARDEVRYLEKELENKMKEWDGKTDLFDIEFESTEKEVETSISNMVINGDTVYDCNKRRR